MNVNFSWEKSWQRCIVLVGRGYDKYKREGKKERKCRMRKSTKKSTTKCREPNDRKKRNKKYYRLTLDTVWYHNFLLFRSDGSILYRKEKYKKKCPSKEYRYVQRKIRFMKDMDTNFPGPLDPDLYQKSWWCTVLKC